MTALDHPPVSLVFTPVDTWYFADATPPDATGSGDLGGIFPPHPTTVVGAVRAELARAHGWPGSGSWPEDLHPLLGDGYGADDLGRLRFDGPYLVRCGQRLFPAPAHLCGVSAREGGACDGRHGHDADPGWRPTTLMRPGDEPVVCDLGAVRLPERCDAPAHPADKAVPREGLWLHARGFAQVLRGERPDPSTLVTEDELWHRERRIGLTRDRATRTAAAGALYTTRHVRPRPGVGIGVTVHGLPPEAADRLRNGALVPFGGEARMARLYRQDVVDVRPPAQAAGDGSGPAEVALVALTPLDVDDDVYRGRATLPELGGARVVSACLPRPRRIGGWASASASGAGPRMLRSTLPPGAVLFCEVDPGTAAQAATSPHVSIGHRPRWGFGAAALGQWPAWCTQHATPTMEGAQ